MANQCVFCRIVRGEIPAQLLANTADCVAFRDLDPKAPVHILIIPKKHIASLDDITEPDIPGKLTMLAAALARQEGIAASGYRTVMNTGTEGGQSVSHIHLHLLGGRQMTWPPG
jgi:histidine triad (HIT) family protein